MHLILLLGSLFQLLTVSLFQPLTASLFELLTVLTAKIYLRTSCEKIGLRRERLFNIGKVDSVTTLSINKK